MAKIKIITHNGRFHTDDVCAVAALILKYGKNVEIIRTRDEKAISSGDIVVDVGGEYEPSRNRFDHHQKGGAGKRDNDIPFASFGLVWKEFGESIAGNAEVAAMIDRKIVQPVDAVDNGVDITESIFLDVYPYTIQTIISTFVSTWKEKERDMDEVFIDMVELAGKLLTREISIARDEVEAYRFVELAYEKAKDKRIIVLDDNYPFAAVLNKYPEPLYVVRPRQADNAWAVDAIQEEIHTYVLKKPFPLAWAGKRDKDFADETGVTGAKFCHNGRFMAVAETKEAALCIANIAADA